METLSSDFTPPADTDFCIFLEPTQEIKTTYLMRYFKNLLSDSSENTLIPSNLLPLLDTYKEELLQFLNFFHLYFSENKPKKVPAKAQHRFKKAFSTIPFYVDFEESQAVIHWEKRDVFRIEKGSILKKEPPLKKDGSIGLSAKMGLQLRSEHEKEIKNYQTTTDIFLKSVNEIGLFLYFGQTNSWLVLKDQIGKTIQDYSVVS